MSSHGELTVAASESLHVSPPCVLLLDVVLLVLAMRVFVCSGKAGLQLAMCKSQWVPRHSGGAGGRAAD